MSEPKYTITAHMANIEWEYEDGCEYEHNLQRVVKFDDHAAEMKEVLNLLIGITKTKKEQAVFNKYRHYLGGSK
jgi:hypothetical protein